MLTQLAKIKLYNLGQTEDIIESDIGFIKELAKRHIGGMRMLPHEWADIYQECILGCIKSLDKYDSTIGCSFLQWYVMPVRAACKKVRNEIIIKAKVKSLAHYGMGGSIPPAERLEYLFLRDAVNELPEPLRSTTVLYYGLESRMPMVMAEISLEMGCSTEMISRWHKKAIEKLREVYIE